MKKTKNLKTICLSLVAMALIITMSAGTALAYFTSNKEATGEQTLSLGFAYAKIIEEVNPQNGWKKITLRNAGEVDCYVRMKAFAASELKYSDSSTKPQTTETTIAGWELEDSYYKYVGGSDEGILKPGEETSPIYVHFDIPSGGDSYNVIIIQECTPVLYDSNGIPYADWDAKEGDSTIIDRQNQTTN